MTRHVIAFAVLFLAGFTLTETAVALVFQIYPPVLTVIGAVGGLALAARRSSARLLPPYGANRRKLNGRTYTVFRSGVMLYNALACAVRHDCPAHQCRSR
jgi:hypothetical protein